MKTANKRPNPITLLALATLAAPVWSPLYGVTAQTTYTVNGLNPRPQWVDNCKNISRHDEMADCYFRAGQWKKVIWAFETTPPRSLDYPNEGAQNRADITGSYERAVAYKHLGNVSEEKTWIYLAYSFPDASKWVSKSLWARICAEYSASGERVEQTKADTLLYGHSAAQEQHDNALWARQQGMSPEEVDLVKYRGKPCHIETYNGDNGYHTETFWYCNGEGTYEEAYTVTNGHQTSHYVP